jgi:hypothetical protein
VALLLLSRGSPTRASASPWPTTGLGKHRERAVLIGHREIARGAEALKQVGLI